MADFSQPHIASALERGGEMGALIRAMDWAASPLGPVAEWPPTLLTAVGMMLNSRFPTFIGWGPGLVGLYNDAYRPILGMKHPVSLGQKEEDCWPEIWGTLGPVMAKVRLGEAAWAENQRFSLNRHGFLEECYFTFSCSPIWDESGGVGGVLTVGRDTTGHVIGGRRMAFISGFSGQLPVGKDAEQTAGLVCRNLGGNALDIPFSRLYILDERRDLARLAGSSGIVPGTPGIPAVVGLSDNSESAWIWSLAEVLRTNRPVRMESIGDQVPPLPDAAWPEPPQIALAFPIKELSREGIGAVLVLGISPRLRLDESYQGYLQLVADRVAGSLAFTMVHRETEQQRAWLNALFLQAPAPICILHGADHVFVFANPPYYEMVNRKRLIGKTMIEVFPELAGQGLLGILDRAYRGEPFTAQEHLVHLDRGPGPEPVYFRVSYQPMRNAHGTVEGIMVFSSEITMQVLARRKAEESSADLAMQKSILETIALGSPLPTVLESMTRNAEALFEGACASIFLLSPDGRQLSNGASPCLPRGFISSLEGMAAGSVSGYGGNGEKVVAGDISTDPRWQEYQELALQHGLRACWCIPVVSSSGRILATFSLYFMETRIPAAGELNRLETLARAAAIAIERRRAEESLRLVQDQLFQAQKMESVGKLAGGIAHDFNNLLTAITGYSEISLAMIDAPNPVHGNLLEIKNAGARAADLTKQLLAYSRKQMLSSKIVDLNALIRDLGKLLKRILGENIELELEFDTALRSVKVDPGKIEQVVMNLVVNARDAISAAGTITIRTRAVIVTAESAGENPSLVPGSFSMLSVKDSGSGMSDEVKAHVFEPFFTTKAFGKGSGMGLSTVYGIVIQSGGSIFLESGNGQGSTFSIYLPTAEGCDSEIPAPAVRAPFASGETATILLVEDETTVRRLLKKVLEGHGYTVLEAQDGIEGLEIGGTHAGTIDLILTDVVMPRLNGIEMVNQLRSLRPDLRVLFMSGYPEVPNAKDSLVAANSHFIHKPFTPYMILDEIEELLNEATRSARFRSGSAARPAS
ncbi:MAG TPA: response regulator [Fibrobacteria bacterium]|nr:response regulator [Fibrobacteria bacterium]